MAIGVITLIGGIATGGGPVSAAQAGSHGTGSHAAGSMTGGVRH